MAKKRIHISAQGEEINFDLLLQRNPNTIAIGNANMNARGDIIGTGGKIIQTAEERNAAQLEAEILQGHEPPDPNAAYNTNDPNAIKMVSIKDNIDQIIADEATHPVKTPTPNENVYATGSVTSAELASAMDPDLALTPAEAIKAMRNPEVVTEDKIEEKPKQRRAKKKLVDSDD